MITLCLHRVSRSRFDRKIEESLGPWQRPKHKTDPGRRFVFVARRFFSWLFVFLSLYHVIELCKSSVCCSYGYISYRLAPLCNCEASVLVAGQGLISCFLQEWLGIRFGINFRWCIYNHCADRNCFQSYRIYHARVVFGQKM